MRTREGHGIEVRSRDTITVSAPDAASDNGPAPDSTDPDAPPPPRRGLAVGLAAALALAVVATLVLAVTGGDEDVVAGSDPAAVDVAAGPHALGLTVEAPEQVVAGERARFTVHWTDGSGIFSGSSEDWGDAVATSSRKQGRCEPGAAAPPAAGTYAMRHTWSEPGTYSVVLGVATYTCGSGSAVEEEASKTVTVEVLPAG